jgi:hypothetical protein
MTAPSDKTPAVPAPADLLVLELERRKLTEAERAALAMMIQSEAIRYSRDRLRADLGRLGVMEPGDDREDLQDV